ncbi:transketolase subunit A, partial [mine drainage metagenome]
MAEGVSEETVRSLETAARRARHAVLGMIRSAGRGHPGRSLAVCDLLVALYRSELRVDVARPDDPVRDRLVLADPDAAPALYAALADRGFVSPDELADYGRAGRRLPVRPDRTRLPGVDVSAAAPGIGVAVGVGLALGARLGPHPFRTYVLVGESDRAAGIGWEALAAAGHARLADLVVILTRSGAPGPDPATERLRSLGYLALDVDGHDPRSIVTALGEARRTRDRPTAILALTVPGRGVPAFEATAEAADTGPTDTGPTDAELDRALAEMAAPPSGRPPVTPSGAPEDLRDACAARSSPWRTR